MRIGTFKLPIILPWCLDLLHQRQRRPIRQRHYRSDSVRPRQRNAGSNWVWATATDDLGRDSRVEVVVTAGPSKTPVAHQSVYLETPHRFSWKENGTKRNDHGGRRWSVTTNEQGKARTFAMPAQKIDGSIYTPEWRAQASAEVTTGGVTRLEFHRPVADARKITGRLLMPREIAADLSGTVVEIGSIDGETEERSSCKTNAKGEFRFESKAGRIGIYARTKNRKAAGAATFDTQIDRSPN